MESIKIGDLVARKSYGGDNPFVVTGMKIKDGSKIVYELKGLLYRIAADAYPEDLTVLDPGEVTGKISRDIRLAGKSSRTNKMFRPLSLFQKWRRKPGRILHIDSSKEFSEKCVKFYQDGGVQAVAHVAEEREQPEIVENLLKKWRPDILVLTGHDGLKKGAPKDSLESYRNSRYFVKSVRKARTVQPEKDKLCIFAGACQSYFEAIMAEGANFGSSPGRILIHALDPGIVSEKVALTDRSKMVTPSEIAELTVSGPEGIGGINTRGHML